MSFVSALAGCVAIVASVIPPINIPRNTGGDPPFPAPPGYLLPWAGGEIQSVTQSEETVFTHNGLAAYAYDFDLSYDTIVASRAGRVALVYDGSNSGGCGPEYAHASNYVVIDHGDDTSALYLHIAYDSAQVQVGDLVHQGTPIAIAGETGFTCSDDDSAPGPHLHFQVQRSSPDAYFTQSLPVAFDDIPRNTGVPEDGASYVSGNFGPGKPQKIALTPYRVPRVFNPQAKPANPELIEAVPGAIPPPPAGDGAAHDPNAWADAATAFAVPSETSTPDPTNTPTKTPTPRPEPSDTPEPPPPADTPPPAPSNTPVDTPTAETPTTEAAATEPPATAPPATEPPVTSSSSPLAAPETIAP
jgi:murein DD-endopeptidase MepM/ murein hydrolase activator NlpD